MDPMTIIGVVVTVASYVWEYESKSSQDDQQVNKEELQQQLQAQQAAYLLMKWEFPRLCRGGTRSLTDTGVHPRNSRREPRSTRKGETGWTSMKA